MNAVLAARTAMALEGRYTLRPCSNCVGECAYPTPWNRAQAMGCPVCGIEGKLKDWEAFGSHHLATARATWAPREQG